MQRLDPAHLPQLLTFFEAQEPLCLQPLASLRRFGIRPAADNLRCGTYFGCFDGSVLRTVLAFFPDGQAYLFGAHPDDLHDLAPLISRYQPECLQGSPNHGVRMLHRFSGCTAVFSDDFRIYELTDSPMPHVPGLVIHRVGADDQPMFEALSAVYRVTHEEDWPPSRFAGIAAAMSDHEAIYLACLSGVPCGLFSINATTAHYGHLGSLGVLPAYRGRHIATSLAATAMGDLLHAGKTPIGHISVNNKTSLHVLTRDRGRCLSDDYAMIWYR